MTVSAAAPDDRKQDRPRPLGKDAPSPLDGRPGSVATTKRVLLGQLHTEDAASAVAQRIRTAIGLGVLADGEKLPREADLARQLGVTVFALREALSTLRREGLIVTRVGKNGGSYVEHPPPGESMAGEDLVRLSATELRDLADWKAALTTYAARLAARRGSAATADQLSTCVDQLRAAGDPATARRALGRFHVELAAGAQSMRLTRAELVAHEEFDWLAQVALQEQAHRLAVAETMQAVATSVRDGDPEAAWHAGERLVSCVLTELMRARLRMLAARHAAPQETRRSGSRRGTRAKSGDLAAELRAVCGRTVTVLAEMAEDLSATFDQLAEDQAATIGELDAAVARSVLPRLVTLSDVVHGLGFMAEPGVLAEARYWMKWWQRTADGTFERDYRHQMDPARDDFYDYSAKDYMVRARTTGAPSAMGPYIDHGGVDDYVVTVSVPVTGHGSFVGIMATDLRVASLERAFSPWLAQADGTCVLLNAERRVLLSNAVQHEVGDVVDGDAGLSLADVGCFGWVLGRAAGDA